jgi:hypothetical protein
LSRLEAAIEDDEAEADASEAVLTPEEDKVKYFFLFLRRYWPILSEIFSSDTS